MNRFRAPRGWDSKPSRTWVGALGVLIVFLVLYFIITPGASSVSTPTNVANSTIVVALAALGEAIVVLSGGFDLAVGAVLSLVNVILATHFTGSGHNPILALVIACVIGAACGLANGAFVVIGRIPAVIATLGTSFVFAGFALYFLSQPGGEVSPSFVNMLTGSDGILPYSAIVVAVALVVWQYLRRRRFGQAIYAIGADPNAARLSGISVSRNLLVAYTVSGVCYGLASACLTAQTASGDPNVGTPLTLTVFAAVVVGGIRLGGGEGSVASAVTGALILGLISDLLYSAGVSSFWDYVVNGVVLVIAVAVSGAVRIDGLARWLRTRRSPADAAEATSVDTKALVHQ